MFNPNIPQASDVIAISQSDLLNNFGAINTFLNVNHVPFNGANQGKHNIVTFPLVTPTPPPTPTFLDTEIGLFNQNAAPTSRPDIWMQRDSGGTAFPITGYGQNGTFAAAWTYLPSGIKMIWGQTSIASGMTVTIVYNNNFAGVTTFPGFSSTFPQTIQLTPIDNGNPSADVSLKIGSGTNETQLVVLQRGSFTGTISFKWLTMGM